MALWRAEIRQEQLTLRMLCTHRYSYVKVKRADKVRKAGDEARDGVPGFGNKS